MKHAQHAAHIPNSKDGIIQTSQVVAKNRLKDPPTWLKVATTLERPPTPTHFHIMRYDICVYMPWNILLYITQPQSCQPVFPSFIISQYCFHEVIGQTQWHQSMKEMRHNFYQFCINLIQFLPQMDIPESSFNNGVFVWNIFRNRSSCTYTFKQKCHHFDEKLSSLASFWQLL